MNNQTRKRRSINKRTKKNYVDNWIEQFGPAFTKNEQKRIQMGVKKKADDAFNKRIKNWYTVPLLIEALKEDAQIDKFVKELLKTENLTLLADIQKKISTEARRELLEKSRKSNRSNSSFSPLFGK